MVEVAVCQDEIEVSLPLLLTLQTDVGSLSIHMLRVAHTVEQLVEERTAIATVDEISEETMEEMERLNRSFGIGVIKLSPYSDDTNELFPARRNELDYYTIDKLCRINHDFIGFVTKATKVLNAQSEVIEDVKGGLQNFCDKGFPNQEEILAYCRDNHIPC